MATFVVLYKFTEQGVRNIKDSPKRTEAAVKAAARAGMTIRETLWLQGEYDFMAIVEGADELAATAFNINILKLGNVRSHSMRAFTAQEMTKILERVD
ncbi:MAG: GYD domain-containing protein [Roseiarcus sp.]